MIPLVENITSVLKPLETKAIDTYKEEKHSDIGAKKKNRRNKSHDDINTDEEKFTTISVKSLILFLEDFLETRLNSKFDHDLQNNNIKPWINHNQSNDTQLREAASAYAYAAQVSRISVNKIKHVDAPELKNIYALIKDLRRLQECGVSYLNVDSEEALINGVITAVNNAKS